MFSHLIKLSMIFTLNFFPYVLFYYYTIYFSIITLIHVLFFSFLFINSVIFYQFRYYSYGFSYCYIFQSYICQPVFLVHIISCSCMHAPWSACITFLYVYLCDIHVCLVWQTFNKCFMHSDQEMQNKEISSSFDSYSKKLMMLKVFFSNLFDIF